MFLFLDDMFFSLTGNINLKVKRVVLFIENITFLCLDLNHYFVILKPINERFTFSD